MQRGYRGKAPILPLRCLLTSRGSPAGELWGQGPASPPLNPAGGTGGGLRRGEMAPYRSGRGKLAPQPALPPKCSRNQLGAAARGHLPDLGPQPFAAAFLLPPQHRSPPPTPPWRVARSALHRLASPGLSGRCALHGRTRTAEAPQDPKYQNITGQTWGHSSARLLGGAKWG